MNHFLVGPDKDSEMKASVKITNATHWEFTDFCHVLGTSKPHFNGW